MGRLLLSGFLVLFLVGCGKGVSDTDLPPTLQKPRSGEADKKVRDVLNYRGQANGRGRNARIFLIAGGMDNANFAQEIVDQKAIWMNAGFAEEDIVCYYALPLEEQFEEDRAQYESLAGDLKNCFPASPKLLWQDLREASRNAQADFLHLYITSHGAEALSIVAQKPSLLPSVKDSILEMLQVIPEMDQFQITMDALADGRTMNGAARLETMFKQQEPVSDHFFTPKHLRAALAGWSEVPKYITVQGCHSGGFLDAPGDKWDKDFLSNEPGITVLTASRHDRSSFGCNSGVDRTLYGAIYARTLQAHVAHPNEMDWSKVHDEVAAAIREREDDIRFSIDPEIAAGFLPSEPQFFSNQGE